VLIKDPKAIGVSPAYVGQITTIYYLIIPQMFLEDDESDGVFSYFHHTCTNLQVRGKKNSSAIAYSKFQCSPVVVVEVDGAPTGIRPQWGPSNEQFICILCKIPWG
jgi:hypothetical protein